MVGNEGQPLYGLDPLIAEAKRRARRRWAFVAAAVFFAGGGAAAYGSLWHHYSNGVDTRGTPVAVLVARKLLVKGTAGDGIRQGGLYELRDIPRSQVEAGAILNPASLSGKVIQQDVSPGQQLTAAVFSRPRYETNPSPPVPTIRVLVATELIPKGTPGDALRTTADAYKLVTIPRAQGLTGAITDPTVITGKVALERIPPGQQLTAADFGRATR